MATISTEDISVLDGIIYGRVEPRIYAFVTNTIPNYLKVGDTYRPLAIRLNEWREHYSNLIKKFDCEAKVEDNSYFRDYSVHKYLEGDLGKSRLLRDSITDDVYYSKEFFGDTTENDVEAAIEDIKKSFNDKNGKYTFYSLSTLRAEDFHFIRETQPLKLRPNQQEAVEKFKTALAKKRNNLLMYAVMRFGKTFTAMCCAKEMDAKVVVVVSAKADVAIEWKKTVEKTANFEGYSYIDSQQLRDNEHLIKEKLDNGENVVVFLTLQDLQGDMIKDRHKEVFTTDINLLIIDETHFAARAEKYGAVLRVSKEQLKQKEDEDDSEIYEDNHDDITKQLKAQVRLHLSGTPYRILMGSEFTDDDIIAFCQFTDIMDAKEEWDRKYLETNYKDEKTNELKVYEEWDNPYYGFPQMVRFAFNPNESAREKLKELKACGIDYDLSSLFETKSLSKTNAEHNVFKYEKEILDLIKAIDGSTQEEGILPFLDYDKIKEGNMCRHIVFVLPYCASCDAMQKLITEHRKEFNNLSEYEIINIAGFNDRNIYPTVQSIKNKIRAFEHDNKKTITLTVNRMLTGSTVEEWDTMLYLKNSSSPQEYDQAIFRLQNQYIKTYTDNDGREIKFNMKPQTLLVDFDPTRMFYLQEWRSQIYNVNTDERGNNKLTERITKELNISPIIYYNRDKLVQVQASDIMSVVRRYSKERSVLDEVNEIPADLSLLDDGEIADVISEQAELGSKQGLTIKPHEGEEGNIDTPNNPEVLTSGEDKQDNTSETDSDKQENENKKIEKQFRTYYTRILFYAYLTKNKVRCLKDITQSIIEDVNNSRIAKNLNLDNDILCLILSKMDKFILRKLDYKIENINTLVNDDSLLPLERAAIATSKFDTYSESEIRTPLNVAYDMVNLLPKEAIKELIDKQAKVLDIASKSGEFAIAMCKLFLQNGYTEKQFDDLIYSIPTSSIAYEFTRKIYEMLRLNIDNIAENFTAYDLLPKTKLTEKDLKRHRIDIANALSQKEKFCNIQLNTENTTINSTGEVKMKFNVIVGNPPYHESTTDKTRQGRPIYPYFVSQSKYMKPKYMTFIIPSRWFAGGMGLDKFRDDMMQDKRICKIVDFANAKHCFPTKSISGGVAYFLRGLNPVENCTIVNYDSNRNNNIMKRPLNEFSCIVRYNKAMSILRKVAIFKEGSMSEIISAISPYGLPTNTRGQKIWDLQHNMRLFSSAGFSYIASSFIDKNIASVSKYRVMISQTSAEHAGEPSKDGSFNVLTKTMRVLQPNDICTHSYIYAGEYDNRLQADNLLSYLKTKFARFLILQALTSIHLSMSTFKFVPMQDFTVGSNIDWGKSVAEIDQMLYKKYQLTQKEIDFIENNVKPME